MREGCDPHFGVFNDIHHPPPWLDFKALLNLWEKSFGEENVALQPYDLSRLYGVGGMDVLCAALGVKNTFGKAEPDRIYHLEPAPSLTRMRQMNEVLIRYAQARDILIPRDIWSQVHRNVRVPGPPSTRAALPRSPNTSKPPIPPWQNGFRR